MGAKTSAEVKRAVDLVKAGKTRYAAAQECGVQQSSITRSKLYKQWLAEQEASIAAKKPHHGK